MVFIVCQLQFGRPVPGTEEGKDVRLGKHGLDGVHGFNSAAPFPGRKSGWISHVKTASIMARGFSLRLPRSRDGRARNKRISQSAKGVMACFTPLLAPFRDGRALVGVAEIATPERDSITVPGTEERATANQEQLTATGASIRPPRSRDGREAGSGAHGQAAGGFNSAAPFPGRKRRKSSTGSTPALGHPVAPFPYFRKRLKMRGGMEAVFAQFGRPVPGTEELCDYSPERKHGIKASSTRPVDGTGRAALFRLDPDRVLASIRPPRSRDGRAAPQGEGPS